MDANESKGYAYTTERQRAVTYYAPFNLGMSDKGNGAAVGATIDEFCIWYERLNSHQIWQFYVQGGMCDQ